MDGVAGLPADLFGGERNVWAALPWVVLCCLGATERERDRERDSERARERERERENEREREKE
jgi:hypothetical protein